MAVLAVQAQQRVDFSDLVAASTNFLRTLAMARMVALCDTTVLITGESGTGKDVLAQAIHAASSRANAAMLAINCSAIPDTLFESELFGYERGAFTGARSEKPGLCASADGGTLFLDEIDDLPLHLQPKLLRFLENGTYFSLGSVRTRHSDVRIIAATNAPLARRVEQGQFRSDLYYRLAVFPIHIAPLRQRPTDIVALTEYFLRELTIKNSKLAPDLTSEAVEYLAAKAWLGNARELRNYLERCMILYSGRQVTAVDLLALEIDTLGDRNLSIPLSQPGCEDLDVPGVGMDLPALNRSVIEAALSRNDGNVSAAARFLRVSRPALRYRIKKFD